VDAAHPLLDESAVVPPRPERREHRVVEACHVARVLPLDHRPEQVSHDGLDDPGSPAGDAFPDPRYTVVRRDLDECRREGVVGAGAEMDGLFGLRLQGPGGEFVYFQARLSPQGATGYPTCPT